MNEEKESNEKKLNARCPNCGAEFYIDNSSPETFSCPECKKQCQSAQAKKYYSTIHATKEEFKEAHGSDYHKEMLLLDEAYGYIGMDDYENAEKKVYEALELTDSDYKVFMAMVAVKTRNYTDLGDESHKEYINKAIALADQDGKKEIKQIYRPYYLKRQLSEDELEEYHKEEKSVKRSKLEKSLKDLLPAFDIKEKRQKLFVILFPIALVLGFALSIIMFIVTNGGAWTLIGFPLIIAGYIFFRIWFTTRDTVSAFNAILDLFDCLDKIDFDGDDSKLVSVYAIMQKLSERFADGEMPVSMTTDITSLIDALIILDNEELNRFLLGNKFFSNYVEE